MLSLADHYARVDLAQDQDFNEVAEAIRTLLAVCRINRLRSALLVSEQNALDWRSSVRVGIRSLASRGMVYVARLACVVRHHNDAARSDVCAAAAETGIECQVFNDEAQALAWLAASAGEAPAPAERRL